MPNYIKLEEKNIVGDFIFNKFSKIIHKFEAIMNIDESAFNRNIHSNYSWIQKGSDSPIWNSCFAKSFGLISTITTEGISFSLIRTETTNSKCFVDFIDNLKIYLNKHSHYPLNRCWF